MTMNVDRCEKGNNVDFVANSADGRLDCSIESRPLAASKSNFIRKFIVQCSFLMETALKFLDGL